MLKDMTLGQYYPGNSKVHRLDPRVKLLGTLVFIVSLFAFGSIPAYILATIAIAVVVGTSHVPLKVILKGLKPIFILMLITIVFNLFLTPGRAVFQVWKLKITDQGISFAIHMAVRLTYLIIGSSILTFTTTPNALTDGLETGLRWMKIFRVPVHEIAMMMSIALRFIPILMDETDKIMRAQEARGADFHSGGVFQRVKAMVPLLVPLFVSAFRRANDLALAMESRGYHGGEGRTKMKPLVYRRLDYAAYLAMALYLAIQIALKAAHVRIPLPFL